MQPRGYCSEYVKRCLTSTWELPTLTSLNLYSVTLCDDETDKCISKCVNLKNLTLNTFKTNGSDVFGIVLPRLSNLTLENGCSWTVKVINLVTPQLKNLTIRFCYGKFVISATKLASLFYKGDDPLNLISTDGFHSLEKADICISDPEDEDAHNIVRLLQHLHSVKFLTLSLEIVEILSSSIDLILQQPSPFVNLKSLKIYPETFDQSEQASEKVTMSDELKSYLVDSSMGTTFTMVLREEIMAHKLFTELEMLLEKEKDNIKTNKVHLERGKKQVLKAKMKQKVGGNIARIKSGWEILRVDLTRRSEKACLIISKLQCVEELLTMLPASKRAKIQPRFSSLCSEAEIAISKITDGMKIKCDENQSRSSVCFHELAKTFESSF